MEYITREIVRSSKGKHFVDWACLHSVRWFSYITREIVRSSKGKHFVDWACLHSVRWFSGAPGQKNG